MEHLNRDLKQCISSLKFNKDENSVIRVGKALASWYIQLSPVLQQFDKINVLVHQTRHIMSSSTKQDISQIIDDTKRCNIFTNTRNRKYSTFHDPKSLPHKQSENELLQWIKTHTKVTIDFSSFTFFAHIHHSNL